MHFKMSSANCFNLDQSKILSSGNGLMGKVQNLRTGGRCVDPKLGHYFCRGLMMVIATEFTPLSFIAVHCYDDGYVGKQPVAWKEYCVKHW